MTKEKESYILLYMNTRNNEDHFDLYETEEYDPLDNKYREQGFVDLFWTYSLPTVEDVARQALPY